MEPLEGRALLANLLANGDFELGNSGFTSQYPVENATGGYIIGRNPAADRTAGFLSFGDHTTGAGLMNQVDGATIPDQIVWQETVAVSPGTDHTFSGWATSMGTVDPSPARLRFLVNGAPIGSDYPVPARAGSWSSFSAVWNSGAADVATIQIVDLNTDIPGNDFALDDLSLEAIPWAARLVVTTQPPDNVRVGIGFNLTVAVEDEPGHVDASFDGTVAVTLASNPGGAVLDGILTATVQGGVATFSGLTLDRVGSGYTLSIAGDGLAAAATVAFDVAPAPTGPSAYTVDVADASGAGSGDAGDLAYIVARADADANPFGSVIRFDPAVFAIPRTITLTSPLILSQTAGPIAFEGPGSGLLTISGGDASQVFRVDAGATASISGLTIADGRGAKGGGIFNDGVLTLAQVVISGNLAVGEDGDNQGENGLGGGVYNGGTLTIREAVFMENGATGGSGHSGGGSGLGGGVYNAGTLTMTEGRFDGNQAFGRYGSFGGGGGFGGAIYNDGIATIAMVAMDSNFAFGGGNSFGSPIGGDGGAIYNAGTLTLFDASLTGNGAAFGGGYGARAS